jgi:alkanesulfonate monooxygenase SsuD/methylene tetrahydromethanopterin reductase-like flavin-dependent oxidoreductase (luciferase family)
VLFKLTPSLAWNVVTSFSESAAKAYGMDNLLAHDERYAAAEEYMDIVYS